MAEQLQDLEERIENLSNLQPIFGTLKSIAGSARFSVGRRKDSARRYADAARSALAAVMARLPSPEDIELIMPRRELAPVGLVIISSDRGLCGNYNRAIISAAEDFIHSREGREVGLIAVGARGERHFRRRGREITLSASVPLSGQLRFPRVRELSRRISDMFWSGRLSEVWIAHNVPERGGVFSTHTDRYLPPNLSDLRVEVGSPEWDPVSEIEPKELFRFMIPEYVAITLYHYLLDGMYAEQTARFTAMDAASQNAQERIDEITRLAQQMRQASITTATLEVAAGAEASRPRRRASSER